MTTENQSRIFLEQVCDSFLYYLFVEKDEEQQMITKLNEVSDDDEEERQVVISDILRYIFTTEIFEDITAVNIYNWFEEYDDRSIKELLINKEELNEIFAEIDDFINEVYETTSDFSKIKNWHDVILSHFLYIYIIPLAEDYDAFRVFINNLVDSVIFPK
jgi:hypothetical protein